MIRRILESAVRADHKRMEASEVGVAVSDLKEAAALIRKASAQLQAYGISSIQRDLDNHANGVEELATKALFVPN